MTTPPFLSFLPELRATFNRYPRQFWLMFFGMLISTIGTSMIWPFLMIYVSGRLHLPLSQITILMTINSAAALLAGFTAGPIVDRLGRKWIMILGLVSHGISYLLLSQAQSFPVFALLMGMTGAVTPLYRIGGDAMMADLVPPEQRVDGYALLRMSHNLGIAIGPAIGGTIAATSYNIAFIFAATGLTIYSLLLLIFARETLPKDHAADLVTRPRFGGYEQILRDASFVRFLIVFTLVQFCATMIWVLMGVYAKENFQVPENQYGFIPATNALMVVTLQILVTQITKRFPVLPVLAVGAFFYASAIGGVALAASFWGFWVCMVVMTIGELVLMPTSSTYVANLAPPDMRGRYMSLYSLTWGIATGIGPLLGGVLNDLISPRAIWVGGSIIGFTSVFLFMVMSYAEKTSRLRPASG